MVLAAVDEMLLCLDNKTCSDGVFYSLQAPLYQ